MRPSHDTDGPATGEERAALLHDSDVFVVRLGDARSSDASIAGAKAANLARCAASGLPTLPGFVVTTAATASGLDDPSVEAALLSAWESLSGGGKASLVVRSSSTIEDAASSSMAGRFTSVLDVRGWPAFLDASREVLASAEGVRDEQGCSRPMAVLVQPQLDAQVGGVLFGVDPVSGDRRHVVVEAVGGGPDALVSGQANAAHLLLGRRGRVVESMGSGQVVLDAPLRRALVKLARGAAHAFDAAQDVEWAQDSDGRLWLLQSRPVTAIADHAGRGHRFGPGPVAETFPAAMHRLEEDLWLVPLRDAIRRALLVTGAAGRRRIEDSPVVTTVGGWAAVDLDLLGVGPAGGSWLPRLNPVPALRRLVAAWGIGRLRVALPRLASDLIARVDADLESVPSLDALSDGQLVGVCDRARVELAAAHTLEVLAGMLLHRHASGPPAQSLALSALAAGRAGGLADAEIIAAHPVVLTLCAPAIGADAELPATSARGIAGREPAASVDRVVTADRDGVDELDVREGLRLRTRWLQELTARAAETVGERLALSGVLASPTILRDLAFDELGLAVAGGPVPQDLPARASTLSQAPLPAAFRLAASGGVIPARHARGARAAGVPAGGGRAAGLARHRVAPGSPRSGHVLVVAHLEPALAGVLPSLDGLVSETGGALSHLAILAREMGIPTVVGVPDARRRFPPGVRVLVDGGTGDVELLNDTEVST